MTINKVISRTALCSTLALATTFGAHAQDASMPGEGTTVDMARATWDTGFWQAEVYSQLLEELGYDVSDPTTLDAPAFYQAVALGEVDLWVNGWFPLHNSYEDTFTDGAEKVGMSVEAGALQGYLIDKASAEKYDITTVKDMQKDEVQKAFDSNGDGKADLVGCPPGWGCEVVISHQYDALGWEDDFNIIQGGYSASMADVVGRFQNDEPVFFYTWTPNWTVGELKPGEDVVWLQMEETSLPESQADLADETLAGDLAGCRGEMPCDLGWPANDIRPVANTAFLDENPAARELLEQVSIPIEDIFTQNAKMNQGADSPEDIAMQAETWIEDNRDKVDQWLQAARDAAS